MIDTFTVIIGYIAIIILLLLLIRVVCISNETTITILEMLNDREWLTEFFRDSNARVAEAQTTERAEFDIDVPVNMNKFKNVK